MKWIISLLFCSVLMLACHKETTVLNSSKSDGCIEQAVIPVSQHDVADSDVQTIDALFTNSGVDNHRFRYLSYQRNSAQTYYPPYAIFKSQSVLVDQYANGLRIFNAQMGFNWTEEGVLYFQSGYYTKGTQLNTKAKLELTQLRQMFLGDVEKYDSKGEAYKDTCLKAEFGYLNINAGTGDTMENLIKAWRITPLNSVSPSEYPVAYYKDDNADLIYYTDGIQTFR